MVGNGGISLFYFYFGKIFYKKEFLDKSVFIINNLLKSNFSDATFAYGSTGIMWLLEFFNKNNFLTTNLQISNEVKRSIYEYGKNNFRSSNADLFTGGLGACLFFLEIFYDGFDKKYIEYYIDEIQQQAESEGDCIKWSTTFYSDGKPTNERIYNLGLAHGIPSIISVLSMMYEVGIRKDACQKLLKDSINWVLNQELPSTFLSRFSLGVMKNNPKELSQLPSRLAWCYGDLGIASAIWMAGISTSNEEWKKKAVEIMLHASKRRDLKENSVIDAGLCHGTSGIAHIFNRFYQATKIEEFKEAAIYWFNETLNMAKFEDGLAGYKTWMGEDYGGWQNSSGLLEGTAGIGLALLAAISYEEPKWDRCLLLS